ncbi:NADH dehydrogenase 1, alpha/beta subcomplex subunit 1 ndufab1/ACP [Kappamyces sp. JEL0680]|nr:NADH dehydrogenase 1, alpha/beta subcomplex subunit 1 ndufab1/ACP [Kappamyces sp. JEL0680]
MNRFFQRSLRIPTHIRANMPLPKPTPLSHLGKTPTLSAFRLYSAGPEPLTLQQIEDRVMGLLKDFDKIKTEKLALDAHFITDLGLDSLDQVEITMALEDEFNVEITDKDAEEIFTPRQAVEKVCAAF